MFYWIANGKLIFFANMLKLKRIEVYLYAEKNDPVSIRTKIMKYNCLAVVVFLLMIVLLLLPGFIQYLIVNLEVFDHN